MKNRDKKKNSNIENESNDENRNFHKNQKENVPQYGNFYKPVAPLFSQIPVLTGRKRKSGEEPVGEYIKLGLLTAGVTPRMEK